MAPARLAVALLEHGLANRRQALVVCFRVDVDRRDGGPRQNVVELVGQHQPPALFEPLARIRGAHQRPRRGGVQLRGVIQPLGQHIAQLLAGLPGIRTAVILQVQLAVPDRHVRALGQTAVEPFEKLVGAAHLHPRKAGQIRQTPASLDHFERGSAAAIAVAER